MPASSSFYHLQNPASTTANNGLGHRQKPEGSPREVLVPCEGHYDELARKDLFQSQLPEWPSELQLERPAAVAWPFSESSHVPSQQIRTIIPGVSLATQISFSTPFPQTSLLRESYQNARLVYVRKWSALDVGFDGAVTSDEQGLHARLNSQHRRCRARTCRTVAKK